MKRIYFELSDSEYEMLNDILRKMRSRKAFINDVIYHYSDLIYEGGINHILKDEYWHDED